MMRWMKALAAMPLLCAVQAQAAVTLKPGEVTEGLLAQQRDGAQASPYPQAALPEQREKAAERFLKTYDRLIPENYYGTTFGAKK